MNTIPLLLICVCCIFTSCTYNGRFNFPDNLKTKYQNVRALEQHLDALKDLHEKECVKRNPYLFEEVTEGIFDYSQYDNGRYTLTIIFCQNNKLAEKFAKANFEKDKNTVWTIQDGILIVIFSQDKAVREANLAYFAKM